MLDVCTLFYNIRDILASDHVILSSLHYQQTMHICMRMYEVPSREYVHASCAFAHAYAYICRELQQACC